MAFRIIGIYHAECEHGRVACTAVLLLLLLLLALGELLQILHLLLQLLNVHGLLWVRLPPTLRHDGRELLLNPNALRLNAAGGGLTALLLHLHLRLLLGRESLAIRLQVSGLHDGLHHTRTLLLEQLLLQMLGSMQLRGVLADMRLRVLVLLHVMLNLVLLHLLLLLLLLLYVHLLHESRSLFV